MLLADWLSQEGLTQRAAAARVGTAPNVFHRYVSGARIPAPAAIRQIYAMTGGAVTANDFHGLPAPRPWIVTLVHLDRRVEFAARGWRPWPAVAEAMAGRPAEAAAEAGVLMRRKQRPGETWQQLLAELAACQMTGIRNQGSEGDSPGSEGAPGSSPLPADALVAGGCQPD